MNTLTQSYCLIKDNTCKDNNRLFGHYSPTHTHTHSLSYTIKCWPVKRSETFVAFKSQLLYLCLGQLEINMDIHPNRFTPAYCASKNKTSLIDFIPFLHYGGRDWLESVKRRVVNTVSVYFFVPTGKSIPAQLRIMFTDMVRPERIYCSFFWNNLFKLTFSPILQPLYKFSIHIMVSCLKKL